MTKHLSAVVISNTPFLSDGQLDEAGFRRQLGRLRDAGLSVYVAGSGSSEGYALTPEERDRVLEIAVAELKGRVPVRAMGCEPHTAQEMVDFLQAAHRSGVDAAQIFSLDIGHGTKPTFAEMDRYYSSTIGATDLPVYLSSHHAAGYYLPLDLIEQLVDRFPTIAGIAYGGSDIPYLAELIARVGDRVEVHCAGPANALTTLGLGGNGFMGGEGNFAPEMVADVVRAYRLRDIDAIRRAFAVLMAFARIYLRFGGSSMRGMKPLMNAYGMPGGHLRPPRLPIAEAELTEMIALVHRLALPGIARPD
ncbi:dihydrodipicolinate synthase family protein [Devosia sp. A369]